MCMTIWASLRWDLALGWSRQLSARLSLAWGMLAQTSKEASSVVAAVAAAAAAHQRRPAADHQRRPAAAPGPAHRPLATAVLDYPTIAARSWQCYALWARLSRSSIERSRWNQFAAHIWSPSRGLPITKSNACNVRRNERGQQPTSVGSIIRNIMRHFGKKAFNQGSAHAKRRGREREMKG